MKMDETMQRIELKRIVEFLRRHSTSDEKTPFALKAGTVTDNGTIAKDSKTVKKDENKNVSQKASKVENEETNEMSVLRKFCLFLSLNVGVLYVVVLAWLLPCNKPFCSPSQEDWKLNFSNIFTTTNLEVVSRTKLPSLAIFGYVDDGGGRLIALNLANGAIAWNITTDFIPRSILCSSEVPFDANGDGTPDCIITSFEAIAAINGMNGTILWQHDVPLSEGSYVSNIHTANGYNKATYVLGIAGESIFVLNARSGMPLLKTYIPCSGSPRDVTLRMWMKGGNRTIWCLVCEYGEKLDVWAFEEEKLLSSTDENSKNSMEYKSLLSLKDDEELVSVSGSLTSTADFLCLSWADTVSMVTSDQDSHFRKTWERKFADTHGHPIAVMGVLAGHFTDSKSSQIAVGLQDGRNSTVHIIDSKNGSTIDSISVGTGRIMSLKKLSKEKGSGISSEVLLVETVSQEFSAEILSNISDPRPVPPQTTTYALLEYRPQSFVVKVIDTFMYVSASAVSSTTSDLLVMDETPDGRTIVHKVHIRESPSTKDECLENIIS